MMSLRKGFGRSLNDFTLKIVPITAKVMKVAPPSRPPMTNAGLPDIIPAMAAKMSGDPFPNAISVTPATFWDMFRVFEIKNRAGQRLRTIKKFLH